MKRYGQSGWYGESYRHYLSAKGVTTYQSARKYNGVISSGAKWGAELLVKGKSYLPVIKIVDKTPVVAKEALLFDKFGVTAVKSPLVVDRAAESIVRAKSLIGTEQGALTSAERLRVLSPQAKLALGNDILKLDAPSAVLKGSSLAEKQIAAESELLNIGRTSPLVKNSIADIGGKVLSPELYSVKGLVTHPLDYKSLARVGSISKSGITAKEIVAVAKEATMANRALNADDFARIAAAHVDEVTGKLGMARGALAGEREALIARLANDYERTYVAGGRGFWSGLSPFKKTLVVGGGVTGGAVFGGSLLTGHGIPGLRTSMDPFETGFWGGNGAGTVPSTGGGGEGGNRVIRNFDENGDYVYDDINGNGQRDSNEPMWAKGDLSAGKTGKSGFPWGAMGAAAVGVGALALALAMSKGGNEEERQRRQQAEMESQLLNQQVRAYREEAMKQIRKNELQRELATLE